MENYRVTSEDCILLLKNKQEELLAGGDDRLPKRSDFTDNEVMAIKSHFGPWPRALEAAGLKPPRTDGTHEKTVEKRIRAKKRRTEAKIAQNNERKKSK